MKRSSSITALFVIALLAWLIAPAGSIFAQGSLTPPTAPAPTMKTLDQVKAGTPIDPSKTGFSTPYTITQSGNYFLTGNIAVTSGDAIDINVNGVNLDLNGFTLSSTTSPTSGYGISVSGLNVAIFNGFIAGGVVYSNGSFSGPGFSYGVYAPVTSNTRVTRVTVSGCGSSGIYMPFGSTVVTECTVSTIGGSGIYAGMDLGVVKNSSASYCRAVAIHGAEVADSFGSSIGDSGIAATNVHNCYGSGPTSGSSPTTTPGIYATTALNCSGVGFVGIQAAVVQNCYAFGELTGIVTSGAVTNSFIQGGSQYGIQGTGNCVISGCTVSGAGTGISAGPGSSVINCAVQRCTSTGIILDSNSVAQNCSSSGNYGDGIATTSGCTGSSIFNCTASGNGGGGTHDGIHLVGLEKSNRVDGNNASNNTGIGIHQEDGPDLIVRNTARNNTSGTNYSPNHGTSVGPIGTPDTATSPWANFQ